MSNFQKYAMIHAHLTDKLESKLHEIYFSQILSNLAELFIIKCIKM